MIQIKTAQHNIVICSFFPAKITCHDMCVVMGFYSDSVISLSVLNILNT